jgi:hypothetical protein
MKFTQGQLKAVELWRVAEGREDAKGVRPGYFEKAAAQLKLAESVASGEFLPQILPAVRRTVSVVHASIPKAHTAFTTRKTVAAIDVAEEVNVFSFGDQTKMLGTHMGDTFVPGGLPRVGPRELYPTLGYTATGKTISAGKFGEAFGVDWESIVRSRGAQVDLIREGFTAFGTHAGQQEDIDVAKLLVNGSGFRVAAGQPLELASAANKTNQPLFTVTNPDLSNPLDVQAAIALSNKAKLTVGTGGTVTTIPVNYSDFSLLCLPEFAPFFRQILGARRIARNPGATAGSSWEETIDFGGNIDVVGWEWLRSLFPTMGRGWILVPKGGELPILTSNYLEGYETPQVFLRDSNSRSIGGGAVNPLVDGDFDNDAATTKVRHVHGANALWTNGIVYSTGANA